MPLELELLIAAWDNAKKNAFGGSGLNIDPVTGEVIDATDDVTPDLEDIIVAIDERMGDLVSYYAMRSFEEFDGVEEEEIFAGEDDDVPSAEDVPADVF